MEYEIDSEESLFDDSTNPSMQPPHTPRPRAEPQGDPAKKARQRAEVIPEEEPSPQMG